MLFNSNISLNLFICVLLLQNILTEYSFLKNCDMFSINNLNFLLKAGCGEILN